MRKIIGSTGIPLNAEFHITPGPNLTLTLESREGGRNQDYAEGLRIILERLGRFRCTLLDAALSSTLLRDRPWNERRLEPEGFAYPIRLWEAIDVGKLRLALGASQQVLGRQPGAHGSGNATKGIDLIIATRGSPTVENLEKLLAGEVGWSVDAKVWWHVKKHDTYKIAFVGSALADAMLEVGDDVVLDVEGAQVGGRLSRSESKEQTQTWLGTQDSPNWTHRINTDALKGVGLHPSVGVQAKIVSLGDSVGPTDDPSELERRASNLPRGVTKAVGNRNPARVAVTSTTFVRDPTVIRAVLDGASGKCERCRMEAPFVKADGTPYLEVHHVVTLSEGGPDTEDNAVALCPNCHRLLHFGAAREPERVALYARVTRLKNPP